MSGIVGIFRRDGGPAEHQDIQRMLNTMPHRGTDSSAIWCVGNVGLGNCMRWTTPESLHEKLPVKSRSGSCILAADARIDNRSELVEALGLREKLSALTDSELILNAYEKWGEDCAQHLIGDFSFAIYDRVREIIFCARDSAGIRCFYYHQSSNLFVFASEIKALATLPFLKLQLDEQRVGDYLVNLHEDRTGTFYKDIFRLPAASMLSISRGRMSIRRYWRLDSDREIRLADDREYAEAFRERFEEAVKCRIRSAFPVGSALSGGMDSSSIACVARNQLIADNANASLHTFSIVFPGLPEAIRPVIDESRYIEKVLETGHLTPHYIQGDKLSPLQDSRRIHYHLDEANLAPNLYLHWGMYGAARDQKVRVFLDGLDGDSTISHGFEYLQELAVTLRWKRLHNETSLLARNLFDGARTRRILWKYCVRDMAPDWMTLGWRLLHGRFGEVFSNATLVHPKFSRSAGLKQRVRRLNREIPAARTARENHAAVLNQALYAHALETADKSAAAFGIEARYPFFDRRLIEFCLALPASQKLGGGWNRIILRRAMEGILPREIQWRKSKGNLSPNFHSKLLELHGNMLRTIAAHRDTTFSKYVDNRAMTRAVSAYWQNPAVNGPQHSIRLFLAANLSLWLNQTNFSPNKDFVPLSAPDYDNVHLSYSKTARA